MRCYHPSLSDQWITERIALGDSRQVIIRLDLWTSQHTAHEELDCRVRSREAGAALVRSFEGPVPIRLC